VSHIEDLELTAKARNFAFLAFEKKYGLGNAKGLSKYLHSVETASILEECGGSAAEIAASLLHDVPEDTDVTLPEIEKNFPTDVYIIVDDCTDLPEWRELPTLARKRKQAERLRKFLPSSKRTKCVDQISNLYRLVRDGVPHHWSKEKLYEWLEGTYLIYVTCQSRLRTPVDKKILDLYRDAYEKAFAMYGTTHGTMLGGQPVCGFLPAKKAKWPLGHRGVDAGLITRLTCPECKDIAQNIQP
jgi:(p)ppGpp synthase/HD superfamily hydrolase